MPAAIAFAMRARRSAFHIASSPSGEETKSASTRQLGISGLRVTAKFACMGPLDLNSPSNSAAILALIAFESASPMAFHE